MSPVQTLTVDTVSHHPFWTALSLVALVVVSTPGHTSSNSPTQESDREDTRGEGGTWRRRGGQGSLRRRHMSGHSVCRCGWRRRGMHRSEQEPAATAARAALRTRSSCTPHTIHQHSSTPYTNTHQHQFQPARPLAHTQIHINTTQIHVNIRPAAHTPTHINSHLANSNVMKRAKTAGEASAQA